jgi:tRNA (guanine37-N1)-methyltransferase
MRIDILTLFPEMFTGPLTESILKRAQQEKKLFISLHQMRDYASDKHRTVDEKPYGGGAGMLMKPEPLVRAIEEVTDLAGEKPYRIYFSPRGKKLTQAKVESLAKEKRLLLLCGHYEGIDERVIEGWIDEELSIGDYVLTGGELPSMVLVDAVARHLPGVLGKEESAAEESFSKSLGRKKEYPHYTRPEEFRGMKVPEVLLSGNHQKIDEWRRGQLT